MVYLCLFLSVVLAAEPVVKVLNGSYGGIHLPQFEQDVFLGIPYAQGKEQSVSVILNACSSHAAKTPEERIDSEFHSR